jgi:hypothetical protein
MRNCLHSLDQEHRKDGIFPDLTGFVSALCVFYTLAVNVLILAAGVV